MVSAAGDVKCFDTVSLSQKLSLHRHALRPITLHFHFLMWDADVAAALPRDEDVEKPPPELLLPPSLVDADEEDDLDSGGDGLGLTGKDSRESSFRFQSISLPDSWL
ncbi:hypothetical protein ACP70R_049744 [Stipagrostis hirtigluma subsp. patula]